MLRLSVPTLTPAGPAYSVNLAALDDVEPDELGRAPVRFADGRNNNWQSPPKYTAHL